MFECSDDIDVDDDFLSGVFENEQENFGNAFFSKVEDDGTNRQQPQQNCIFEDGEGSSARLITVNRPTIPEHIGNSNIDKQCLSLQSQGSIFQPGCSIEILQDNKENKRKCISSPVFMTSKRERKFPGPAGLLPDRKSGWLGPLKLESLLDPEKSPPKSIPDELCSQGRCSGSILAEEPWQSFLADLGSNKEILDVVNVASVKRKAATKCFVGRKVPFLAAVLHHLDVSSPDPCIILRDNTGEIQGTLHREVWEQFAGELITGSVLVIRNVGLFSTGLSSRRHYLNITANNLCTIYSANPDKFYKTRSIYQMTPQDLIQTIENWRTLANSHHGVGSPACIGSPELFSSSLGSSLASFPVPSPRNPNHTTNFINLPRTKVNQNLMNPKRSNITNLSAQNSTRGRNMTSTPNTSLRNIVPPTKLVGKNLLPSFVSNYTQNSPNLNSVSNNFETKILHCPPVRPNFLQPVISPNTFCAQNLPKASCTSTDFNFDPVILKQKRFSQEIFPQSNYERQSNNVQKAATPNNSLNYNSTSDLGENKTKLLLSQSSKLTAEEQSFVESVFDGIDVDSLFDNDF